MAFNENTRVKIPAILHLIGLGYKYLSLKDCSYDLETNIFTDVFFKSIRNINPNADESAIKSSYDQILLSLSNEDLGLKFYELLTSTSGVKLIDFQNIENNTFNVVTELTFKNGEDEFRPDVIVLINGIPLGFIEVKKPNNREGILAERERINTRFKNPKFRKFINILQLLIFSNNMEYDTESIVPIQGAFYSSTSYNEANFNPFREEMSYASFSEINPVSSEDEDFVLKDNNLESIKSSPEFVENKKQTTPTNRIITSLLSKSRFLAFLKYGITYVKGEKGIEKHIMRYPQFFATLAIERKLKEGIRKGIVWHTQGSGKTALSYYNVKYLSDYFQKNNVIPRFYFIVDRLDLMIQADQEFTSRGLIVNTVNSKEELVEDFKKRGAVQNLLGKSEITVVNIQKFQDDPDVMKSVEYDIKTQRIYFLDEVHRSYDPKGSFLANLINSDREAILIGLTGTPLIGNDKSSKQIFGDYFHKYYYNSSVADGYTLKLVREGIETNYKMQLESALKEVEILKGDADKKFVYSHPKFVEPMLDYIVNDFVNSRIRFGDNSIGGMVVCDSADQARKMYEIFTNKYVNSGLTGALILHDVGDKKTRKQLVDSFKYGKIDFLFVFNMLLTGFDAKRLKKLYLGRVIRDHNLLQTLTRVNRPYKNFKYGYVVDFADIRKEFDDTNRAYFNELQEELGDEMKSYSSLFISKEEIDEQIEDIKSKLFHYDLSNSEIFSQQVSQIEDRKVVLDIKKALENAKNLYNVIRLFGHYELLEKLDFKRLNELYNETVRHLELLNLKESIENKVDTTNLLNVALENVYFMFKKVSEDELVIADQLKNILKTTREGLGGNFDPNDPEFINLYEELKRLFGKKNLDEISQEEMKENIKFLQAIYDKIKELNRKNALLRAKYDNDEKYARIHKRLRERGIPTDNEIVIYDTLMEVKKNADSKVLSNSEMLNNEAFFNQLMMQTVVTSFNNKNVVLDNETAEYVNSYVVKEYINEYRGGRQW